MDFKNIENQYRPQPMWLWNSKLNTENTVKSAEKMFAHGFGGFSIRPWRGFKNTHLSDEWFRNISAALKSAADNSMNCTIYCEMPGGSDYSSTAIDSKGLEFHQKFLRFESGEKTNERTIIFSEGYHFYYDANPFRIDIFNEESALLFINETCSPYLTKSNENFNGFMFDISPYFSGDIPWSFTLPAEYKNAYGEELLDVLVELFRPVGNYRSTRFKFWTLISKLFATKFLAPVHSWCTKNGFSFSLINPSPEKDHSFMNARTMPLYVHSDIPCFKAENTSDTSPVCALMASSVMAQFDKKQASALLYSHCGHDCTFEELKHIAELQLVRGINKIIPCSIADSLSGFRKNTVSSPVLLQDFRLEENRIFSDYLARVGKILSEGDYATDILLIHSMADSISKFTPESDEYDDTYISSLEVAIDTLEKKHIPFHVGDELLLAEFGKVEGDSLYLGNHKYKTIVLTENPVLLESTTRLLSEFEAKGGFIVLPDSLPENEICDNSNLLYATRSFSDFSIHYFVNNSSDSFTASIKKGSKLLDVFTGETEPFYGIYKFNAFESIIVIDDGTSQSDRPYIKPLKELDINGLWTLEEDFSNSLLIDTCNVYADDILLHENIDANCITDLLCKNSIEANIKCEYKVNIKSINGDIFLFDNGYDKFNLTVNGEDVAIIYEEPETDDLFLKIRITDYLTEGENTLCLSSHFSCSDKFKSIYGKAAVYETELNKIVYEKEFGAITLSGNFSLLCDKVSCEADDSAIYNKAPFIIDERPSEIDISNITENGFPFFSGKITFKKTFNLSDTSYCIKITPKGIRSIKVEVNGENAGIRCFSPYEFDISSMLSKGDNEIKITLTGNMRNLFGPHHSPLGEIHKVTSKDYYRYPCIWNRDMQMPWNENYSFTKFGISSAE